MAVVPYDWGDYDLHRKVTFGADPQICHLDNSVLYNGHVSIRLDPPFASDPEKPREVNGKWIPVKPGDHIIFKAWMKVDYVAGYQFSPEDANTWRGARIGVSYYGSTGIIEDIIGPSGALPASAADSMACWVLWNTSGWVQKTMDFVVPETVPDRATGTLEVPVGIIPWFQVLGYPNNQPTSLGSGWMADAELYINP